MKKTWKRLGTFILVLGVKISLQQCQALETRAGQNDCKTTLKKTLEKLLQYRLIPEDWKESNVIPTFKKGKRI